MRRFQAAAVDLAHLRERVGGRHGALGRRPARAGPAGAARRPPAPRWARPAGVPLDRGPRACQREAMTDQPDGGDADLDQDFDLEEALGEDGEDEVGARSWSPPDSPGGVFAHGTTAEEEAEGAQLDDRLAAELPDTGYDRTGHVLEEGEDVGGPEVGDDRAGRLVAPDEGAHEDRESELLADDVGEDDGAAGAEEAAVHLVPDEDASEDDRPRPPGPSRDRVRDRP